MRWEELFADLEGQLAADDRRERDAEVADRTRRERALVDLPQRFAAAIGHRLEVGLPDAPAIDGELVDHGDGWLLLRSLDAGRARHELLVPTAAVVTIVGMPDAAGPARTARRFGLGYALRALSRDRSTVAVRLGGGAVRVGTIDVVGADHLLLAEHPAGEPRRRENVRRVVAVPFSAVRAVESLG